MTLCVFLISGNGVIDVLHNNIIPPFVPYLEPPIPSLEPFVPCLEPVDPSLERYVPTMERIVPSLEHTITIFSLSPHLQLFN